MPGAVKAIGFAAIVLTRPSQAPRIHRKEILMPELAP